MRRRKTTLGGPCLAVCGEPGSLPKPLETPAQRQDRAPLRSSARRSAPRTSPGHRLGSRTRALALHCLVAQVSSSYIPRSVRVANRAPMMRTRSQGGATRAWAGMERARVLGYARSIGVSNFGAGELDKLLAAATVPPVVDQMQFSPFEYRRALL